MQEHFHQSQRLPKASLKLLIKRSNHPALAHFLLMYTLYLGTCAWIVLSWGNTWWMMVLAQFAFGLLTCSIFACEHETVHSTAFQSKRLNQIAASLAGIAHLYPASIFRELHFTHHRHTHIPGLDPEISLGNKPVPSVISSPPMYLSWLTGLPLLFFKILMLIAGALGMPETMRQRLFPFVRPKVRREIALESNLVLFVHIGLLLLAIFVHAGFWGLFIGQVVGHCLLASYLSPEHNGLPHEGDILERTRSIRTNKLIKLLMWNMPYHAEHHAYPAVPFHALPDLHEQLKDELKHKDQDHPSFHLAVLRGRLKEQ